MNVGIDMTFARCHSRVCYRADATYAGGAVEPCACTTGALQVLVVDDDPDWLELIGYMLDRAGMVVCAVSSVDDALHVLNRHRPDVVVSDLSMPERDGFALVRAVRSHDDAGRRRISVLAVSASYGREGPERALAEGFDGFLSKPVEPARLIGTLQQLGAAGRRSLLRSAEHPLETDVARHEAVGESRR